ncbi:uncharacterized protein LOC135222949 [Macrobrachium nipponense]|uniref:uncharacterized protein LOC135222949 n=1 Tax=Macrobrachium nipponense TaxID=159736 RepID=UPI0030C7AD7F
MADENTQQPKPRAPVIPTVAKHNVIYLVLILSLLAYSVFVTIAVYRDSHPVPSIPDGKPPYLPIDLSDLYDFITATKGTCVDPSFVPGTSIRDGENTTVSGHEGTYICLDGIPSTPDSCRIYSFGFNRDDIKFENRMGKLGCRVHLVSGKTEYSYTPLGNNVYLYPLTLSNFTELGKYTLDNFLNLMNHMDKPIHYVKTEEEGSEWTLLQNLYTSSYKAPYYIKQLRLLLHLPIANDDNISDLLEKYRLLLGLEYYGYKLLYSRPIPGTLYYHLNLDMEVATKYETVWVRP